MTFAQSPKQEIRATWLATVWNLDWPKSGDVIPEATGSNDAQRQAKITAQKNSLITIMDNLAAANYNAVFFQVRTMCDALYKSSYEPWSQWISAVRGSDPGYDPLAFAIEEAHKRGIELHAWINPYRYSTSSGSHGNLPTDYAQLHPDWLLEYKYQGNPTYCKILNPGVPEVRQRICDIVADIVEHYDVDGIVFDDYFYASDASYNGQTVSVTTTDAMDQNQYQAYNPDRLSRGDWRRANVNKMIEDVYNRIQSVKPYVTFGVGPAGAAASDKAVADKYGLEEPCPISDWQYNSIYSDPVAWLYEGTIDYISPQLYWTGDTYTQGSEWWSKVSKKFFKHFYSSHSIGSMTTAELGRQIDCNRTFDRNGAPGNVFYANSAGTRAATVAYLNTNQFQYKAITPSISWKPAPMQSPVENLTLSAQTLSWTYGQPNVRYVVYAVPNAQRNDPNLFATPLYIQGISYTKQFTLPAGISAGSHLIAVSVLDYYGNEFGPRVLGENPAAPEVAALTYPADNAITVLPALFTWEPVSGADHYLWQLSRDANFNDLIVSRETIDPQFNSGYLGELESNVDYWWRVKTVKPNANDIWSDARRFTGDIFRITSPANEESDVALAPTFTWSETNLAAEYTLEISTNSQFATLAYSGTSPTNSLTIPEKTLLTGTVYYARVLASVPPIQIKTPVTSFKVIELDIPVPTILSPANESGIPGTSLAVTWAEQPARGFKVDLSTSASFPITTLQTKMAGAYEYSTQYDNLTAGKTYYLRVAAQRVTGFSAYSPTVKITMGATGMDEIPYQSLKAYVADGNLTIQSEQSGPLTVSIYSLAGQVLSVSNHSLQAGNNTLPLNTSRLSRGVYLLRLQTAERSLMLKMQF
jgi:uncharacterized lipoprotein YddW (UPF0748 family)